MVKNNDSCVLGMEKENYNNDIEIPVNSVTLKGYLRSAKNSKGIVLFSHGSGSSRLSSRNNYIADFLLTQGFSSLLFDLLTPQEDTQYENRFNIELLTERLLKATHWILNNKDTKHLPIAYFGASTGAASALAAASSLGDTIKTIVSRGGRPDLVMPILDNIESPTLLIVGGHDMDVLLLNEKAKSKMNGICELKIVKGASHLFEEPGALAIAAQQTANWLNIYLGSKKDNHV